MTQPGPSSNLRHPMPRLFELLLAAMLLGGCVQASQVYPLFGSRVEPSASTGSPSRLSGPPRGSVQIERIEGDQRLLALKLERLAPPESWGAGCVLFVAWVEDSRGRTVKVGPLSYDRARQSGRLLGTVPEPVGRMDFRAFTVKVTAERETEARAPSGVLLAGRHLKNQ